MLQNQIMNLYAYDSCEVFNRNRKNVKLTFGIIFLLNL